MDNRRPLGGYIRSISNALSQRMQQNCDAQGLTSTQGMFLHHLWIRKYLRGLDTCARDLEQFFDVRHSTVSGILQRMESAGFVTFQTSPDDHRSKTIHLTEKALHIHEQTKQHILNTEALLIRGMTAEEASEFRRLLVIAADNLGVCCHNPKKEEPSL